MKKICVMGLGYIGLPTASLLATKGYEVLGVDIRKDTVDAINSGKVPIVEPDLDILVKSAVGSGRLKAALKPGKADVFILAVPTPFLEEDGNRTPDVTYVMKATEMICPHLTDWNLVVLESTSPVGTTEEIAAYIKKHRPGLSVHVVHCPERVIPGQVLRELVENDRIIGGITPEDAMAAGDFYRTFVNGEIHLTQARTAELSKLVENSFRDVNIAFANELSLICEKLDVDVWELISLANKHPRVKILQPGPGVGGHCIAVDPYFVIHACPDETPLMQAARQVNLHKTEHVVEKVMKAADKFKNPVIACLGLSYKNDIDDLRESPALEIVAHLTKKVKGTVLAVEPNITEVNLEYWKKELKGIKISDLNKALTQADIVVLLVGHREFVKLERQKLQEKLLIDTRGIFG
ncbi:MAG: UDP-N-acetyl-D-mannosamine dehydrogenase [Candidatus Wallbacteria bacterium]|nr:UDP-N-acetyl-D-mannosamine dehydrogenase [Candidatus Wallbacteria bacterium]